MNLGQVFTSSPVSDYMVAQFSLSKDARILDPCFGDGAFLLSLKKDGYVNVTGIEIDKKLFQAVEKKYADYIVLNCDYLSTDLDKFDGIIMNPPYIRHEVIDDLQVFGITKRILRANPLFEELPATANIYMYFIIKAISQLKENGELIVIFPSSWMKARSGEAFMNLLKEKCGFEKEIRVSGNVFENNVLVDVIILKLVKGKRDLRTKHEVFDLFDGVKKSSKQKKMDLGLHVLFPKYASIRRGLTTGYNEMYINPPKHIQEHFIKDIISSPKSISGYTTKGSDIDKILMVEKGEKISQQVKEYFELWKYRIIEQNKPKTLLSKIKLPEWYTIKNVDSNGILFSYIIRNDMKFVLNERNCIARDNFYIIKPSIDVYIMIALLNNYYTYYQLELLGKKYGAGLLKIQKYDFESVAFPDLDKIDNSDRIKLKKLGLKLTKNGDDSVIGEISDVLAAYSNLGSNEIKEEYLRIKKRRLEGK